MDSTSYRELDALGIAVGYQGTVTGGQFADCMDQRRRNGAGQAGYCRSPCAKGAVEGVKAPVPGSFVVGDAASRPCVSESVNHVDYAKIKKQ